MFELNELREHLGLCQRLARDEVEAAVSGGEYKLLARLAQVHLEAKYSMMTPEALLELVKSQAQYLLEDQDGE